MAANDIYRSYQAIIEESIDRRHPSTGKSKKAPLFDPAVIDALHTTNRLYQDALCYYILALAGLAVDEQLNPLWKHLVSSLEMRGRTSEVLARLAGRYPYLSDISTADAFVKKIYSAGVDDEARRESYQILEQQGVEQHDESGGKACADLSNFASDWASILCDPEGETDIPGNRIYDVIHRRLKDVTDVDTIERELLDEVSKAHHGHQRYQNEKLRRKIAEAVANRKPKQDAAVVEARVRRDFAKEQSQQEERTRARFLKAFTDTAAMTTKYRRLSQEQIDKAVNEIQSAAADDVRFRRLRYGKRDNSFEQPFFRFLWLREDAACRVTVLEDMRLYIEKETPEPEPNNSRGEPVMQMPYRPKARILFPFFTSLLSLGGGSRECWDFDKAAFAEAAEDVFKYKIRTEKRLTDLGEVDRKLAAFRGAGEWSETKRAGKTVRIFKIRGMEGDSRAELMAQLLDELGHGLGGYTLRPATIGGWADLRKMFLKKAKAGNENLPDLLVEEVESAQARSAGGFGSAAFFAKLCEERYFDLWRSDFPKREHHADNFVRHYVKFSELQRERRDLLGDIRFTWPGDTNRHGDISYRHLDFTGELGPTLVTELFCERDSVEGEQRKIFERKEFTLTLSGRRLKRDRIVTADGQSLESFWGPPLVDDENGLPGITAKKKRGGKPLTVSYSLMVKNGTSRDENGHPIHPPVYLNVAVQVAGKELAKIQGSPIKWESSLRRNPDFTGRYFRWPIDLVTDKTRPIKDGKATVEKVRQGPKQLWCGDGHAALQEFKPVNAPSFHILSIDLGVRCAAAFARAEVRIGGTEGRRLSPDAWKTDIRFIPYRFGEMRLPGEDAIVWEKGKGFVREEFGRRGRFPTTAPDEIDAFEKLARKIHPEQSFALRESTTLTVPEMGDHLLVRFSRRLSRIRALFNLRWRLRGKMERNPDSEELVFNRARTDAEQITHRRLVAEFLSREFLRRKDDADALEEGWLRSMREKLAAGAEWEAAASDLKKRKKDTEEIARQARLNQLIAPWNWTALADAIDIQLGEAFDGNDELSSVELIVERLCMWCLPLRDKTWSWKKSELTLERTGKATGLKIRGMRGLSLPRIEQIQSLRRTLQSLAKLEKRRALGATPSKPGIEPLPTRRNETVGDACPELLEKINELRDQRVFQTAHMILAEALGRKLRDPSSIEIDGKNKPELKSERDLHGVYEPLLIDGQGAPRCAVIILENLTRYRTSQDRGRYENRRLMEWSHRNIIKKVQDMAKPFRIEIVLVDAAYSSRFDSRTGGPGVRVKAVKRGFEKDYPFSIWIAEISKSKARKGQPTPRAAELKKLKQRFEESCYDGELLVAVEGGPLFMPIFPSQDSGEALDNADINAAVSIGLRALAHPDRLDVFPLIKTEALTERRLRIRNPRGAFAALREDEPEQEALRFVECAAGDSSDATAAATLDAEEPDELETNARPNLFVDVSGQIAIADSERFPINIPGGGQTFGAAKAVIFWPRVRQLAVERVQRINEERLRGSQSRKEQRIS